MTIISGSGPERAAGLGRLSLTLVHMRVSRWHEYNLADRVVQAKGSLLHHPISAAELNSTSSPRSRLSFLQRRMDYPQNLLEGASRCY